LQCAAIKLGKKETIAALIVLFGGHIGGIDINVFTISRWGSIDQARPGAAGNGYFHFGFFPFGIDAD